MSFAISLSDFGKKRESSSYYCTFSEQKYNSLYKVYVLSGATEISNIKKNKDIMLVDDLRGDELWGMHQLIQRNISHSRVDEIVSGYLRNDTKAVKFFPSITVVLVPKEGNKPGNEYKWSSENGLHIDGIKIFHPGIEDKEKLINNVPVTLSWDKDKISAVVVDGQHRVEALRKFYHGEGSEGASSVSISFVIFENVKDLPVVDATRQLFIDVNNTPKRVSEQKLIFIDDRNLLRRLTAKTLGALSPGDSSSNDPYQELHGKGVLSFSEQEHINKYLIGEDGSDDEDSNAIFRSHSSLFPWEVTHILTLHENIIQSIVLSERDVVDGSASLIKLCRVINENVLEAILDDALEESSGESEDLSEFLRGQGIKDGEREAFIRLIEFRSNYLEALKEIDDSGELKKERDDSRRELDEQYQSKYESLRSFDFSVKTTTSIAEATSNVVCDIVSSVINSLWFVRDVQNLLENGIEGFPPEEAYKFIVMSKEKFSSSDRDGQRKASNSRKEYCQVNDYSEEQSHALRAFVNRLVEITNGNLLRTMVGQQMLFGFLISKDRAMRGDLSYVSTRLGDLLKPINNLGEAGYFDIKNKLVIDLCGVNLELSPWEGLITKGEAMSPGPNNAAKGSRLLNLLYEGVDSRVEVKRKRVRMGHFNSVIMSYGARVFDALTKTMTIDEIWKYLIDGKYEEYLTEKEASDFASEDFPDVDSPTYPRLVKKVLGGRFYEVVYNELVPVMEI